MANISYIFTNVRVHQKLMFRIEADLILPVVTKYNDTDPTCPTFQIKPESFLNSSIKDTIQLIVENLITCKISDKLRFVNCL